MERYLGSEKHGFCLFRRLSFCSNLFLLDIILHENELALLPLLHFELLEAKDQASLCVLLPFSSYQHRSLILTNQSINQLID